MKRHSNLRFRWPWFVRDMKFAQIFPVVVQRGWFYMHSRLKPLPRF